MSHTTSLRVLAESPSERRTGAWIGKSYADRRREVADPRRILQACIGNARADLRSLPGPCAPSSLERPVDVRRVAAGVSNWG
jgi:hypothetical protein